MKKYVIDDYTIVKTPDNKWKREGDNRPNSKSWDSMGDAAEHFMKKKIKNENVKKPKSRYKYLGESVKG